MPLKRIQLFGFLSHSVLNDFLDQDQPRKKKKKKKSSSFSWPFPWCYYSSSSYQTGPLPPFSRLFLACNACSASTGRISVLHRWFNNNKRMGHSSLEREENNRAELETQQQPTSVDKKIRQMYAVCHFISHRNIKK